MQTDETHNVKNPNHPSANKTTMSPPSKLPSSASNASSIIAVACGSGTATQKKKQSIKEDDNQQQRVTRSTIASRYFGAKDTTASSSQPPPLNNKRSVAQIITPVPFGNAPSSSLSLQPASLRQLESAKKRTSTRKKKKTTATITDTAAAPNDNKNNPNFDTMMPFAWQVHCMVTQVSVHRPDIMRWVDDGKAFLIDKPSNDKELVELLQTYFYHGRLDSLHRRLNMYGWKIRRSGKYKGAFYHNLFHRDWTSMDQFCQLTEQAHARKSVTAVSATAVQRSSRNSSEMSNTGAAKGHATAAVKESHKKSVATNTKTITPCNATTVPTKTAAISSIDITAKHPRQDTMNHRHKGDNGGSPSSIGLQSLTTAAEMFGEGDDSGFRFIPLVSKTELADILEVSSPPSSRLSTKAVEPHPVKMSLCVSADLKTSPIASSSVQQSISTQLIPGWNDQVDKTLPATTTAVEHEPVSSFQKGIEAAFEGGSHNLFPDVDLESPEATDAALLFQTPTKHDAQMPETPLTFHTEDSSAFTPVTLSTMKSRPYSSSIFLEPFAGLTADLFGALNVQVEGPEKVLKSGNDDDDNNNKNNDDDDDDETVGRIEAV